MSYGKIWEMKNWQKADVQKVEGERRRRRQSVQWVDCVKKAQKNGGRRTENVRATFRRNLRLLTEGKVRKEKTTIEGQKRTSWPTSPLTTGMSRVANLTPDDRDVKSGQPHP